MNSSVPSNLIEKYLEGKCSVEEELQLSDWYNSLDYNEDPILLLTEIQKQELKFKMLSRIREEAYMEEVSTENTAGWNINKIYVYAATLAAIFIIIFSLYKPVQEEPLLVKANKVKSPYIYFSNTSKKLDRVILPDNSIVWLKPESTISYEKTFGNKFRKISLKGEAFFEVKKDREHPFMIYSGGVVTRVLGTSFNVKANEDVNTTEVSVVTGKVFVYTPESKGEKSKSVYLLPEQKATYLRTENQLVKYDYKEPALTIWKKNTLSFDNTQVSEVVQTLNKSFDTKISIADKNISQLSLKADFTDVNLPTIMELLSKSLNITYQMQGDKIIISEKPETNINN